MIMLEFLFTLIIFQGNKVYSHTMCHPCHKQWKKGNFCPECNGVFGRSKYKVLARLVFPLQLSRVLIIIFSSLYLLSEDIVIN